MKKKSSTSEDYIEEVLIDTAIITCVHFLCSILTGEIRRMKKSLLVFALLVVAGRSPVAEGMPNELDRRIAVVQNYLGTGYLAFSTDFASGKIRMSVSSDGVSWGDW